MKKDSIGIPNGSGSRTKNRSKFSLFSVSISNLFLLKLDRNLRFWFDFDSESSVLIKMLMPTIMHKIPFYKYINKESRRHYKFMNFIIYVTRI